MDNVQQYTWLYYGHCTAVHLVAPRMMYNIKPGCTLDNVQQYNLQYLQRTYTNTVISTCTSFFYQTGPLLDCVHQRNIWVNSPDHIMLTYPIYIPSIVSSRKISFFFKKKKLPREFPRAYRICRTKKRKPRRRVHRQPPTIKSHLPPPPGARGPVPVPFSVIEQTGPDLWAE